CIILFCTDLHSSFIFFFFFFFQAEDGIRDGHVTGVQTCALPILDRIPGLRMATLFTDDKPLSEVLSGLRQIGYDNGLLQENYAFHDYFASGMQEQRIEAVAFGQTPRSEERRVGKECRSRRCM